MGSQYIPPPEQNVVNVGDEISINALNGIAQASPAITSTNPVATMAGGTFTGKVTGTPSASSAGLNAGTVTSSPTVPVNGDIWVGDNLNFRDKNGVSKIVLVTTGANAIISNTSTNFPLSITQNGNGGGLKITNNGTGDCFHVSDGSANPDTDPFVINADGKVGIGGVAPISANHKVAVHNGSIVFTAGYGVAFGDGTQITSTSGLVQAVQNNLFSGATVYNSTVAIETTYTWTNPASNNYSGEVAYGSQTASIHWNGSTASFVQTLSGSPNYTSGLLAGPLYDPDGYAYGVFGDGSGNVYAQPWP